MPTGKKNHTEEQRQLQMARLKRIQRLHRRSKLLKNQMDTAVVEARKVECSWGSIAESLGINHRQQVAAKYSHLFKAPSDRP